MASESKGIIEIEVEEMGMLTRDYRFIVLSYKLKQIRNSDLYHEVEYKLMDNMNRFIDSASGSICTNE